nr:retrovirus-related Pol polyprotein from transposon TNT 1-94 [Tanacetum cinerariifolium]
MLADSLLPIPFWAEVVNTVCYVQNRVLVTKPHNKTPYELLLGRKPSIGFMRPFGCPVTILNTLDPLEKFDGKADEGFLVGYSVSSKTFRVFNSRTRIVQETLHINFLENQPNVVGSRPTWLFDIDTLTQSMNYQPVFKRPQNTNADVAFDDKANESVVYVSPSSSDKTKKHDEKAKKEAKGKSHVELSTGVTYLNDVFKEFSVNNTNGVTAASTPVTAVGLNSTNSANSFSVAVPSNTAISPKFEIGGKSSFVDPSQYTNDPNMPAFPIPPSPLPTPATSPPSPIQEHIPSPPQAQTTQPSSPLPPQPSQTTNMTLLNTLRMHPNKGKIAELDANKDITLEDIDAKVAMNVDVQGRLAESQAKLYHLDLQHAKKVLSMQDTNEAEHAEVEEVIKVVTVAKLMTKVVTTAATTINAAQVPKASAPRRRNGVVIHDPEKTATASTIRSELNANINWNDVVDQVKRKEKQDNTVMMYQALKRKPLTESQARKNMMVYLKNMVGFKMDFFKGMTYTEIRLVFEKHYNSIQAFLEKVEKEIEEEGSKIKSDSLEQRAAKKQRIDEETEELKTHLQIIANDDDDVYTKATPLALKRRFEDAMEACSRKIQSSEPKNFSDDFLLNTLKIMFEKPNVEANIWRDQKGRYRLAKVKSQKLFESCRVHIITFTTTQMFLE